MSKVISFGELDFKIVAAMDSKRGVLEPETPFHMLILGDFSGREYPTNPESGTALLERRAIEVDRDNLDEVMNRMGLEIRLPLAAPELDDLTIHFKELDDFHPDRIYENSGIFGSIRELRRKLDDPRTFEEAAKQIRSWTDSEPPDGEVAQESLTPPARDSGETEPDGLLDQILGGAESPPAEIRTPSTDPSDWNRFMHSIVKPHLVPGDDPRLTELEETLDAVAGAMMRIILHHPQFQALESGWRGLDFLVSRLETDAQLKIFIFDLSKTELAADLKDSYDLTKTAMYKMLVEQTVGSAGGKPWALIGGNYTFGQTREDSELLGRLAKIAAAAGVPFIAAADSNLLGCDSLTETPDPDDWRLSQAETDREAWQALHNLSESANLGLALPRFLLRLPYGEESNPLEQFDFEEISDERRHEDYLWGNPCFACACLLGQAFSLDGWNLQPGTGGDIDNLPLHIYRSSGETRIKPCAEVLLTERAAGRIMNSGFMPLISFRDQDRIRLPRFQSLTLPPTRLAGRWDEFES